MANFQRSYRDPTAQNPSKLTNAGSFPSQFNALLFCFRLAPFDSSCDLFGSSETVELEIKYDLESHGYFINEKENAIGCRILKIQLFIYFLSRVKFMVSSKESITFCLVPEKIRRNCA
jgi:hypothetical protein